MNNKGVITHCCTFCMAAHSTSLPLWKGTRTEPRNRTRNCSVQPSFGTDTWKEMLTTLRTRDTISSLIVCCSTLVQFFLHLDDVKGGKYSDCAGSHVVAVTPQVLGLDQHQNRVVSLQAQLVLVARNKPDDESPQKFHFLICVSENNPLL